MYMPEQVICISSSSEAEYDGSDLGTGHEVSPFGGEGSSHPKVAPFGSLKRAMPEIPKGLALRFTEGDVTRELIEWYGYVDFNEYINDFAYWSCEYQSDSSDDGEKDVAINDDQPEPQIPTGNAPQLQIPSFNYIPGSRKIFKSETTVRNVVLGLASPKSWEVIEAKLRKRPSK